MFVRNALWSTAGNFTQQAAKALQDFGSRALLPPALLGAWELTNLVRRLGGILEPGILSAAQRDLPVHSGARDHAGAEACRSTAFLSHVGGKLIVAVGIAVYALASGRYTRLQLIALLAASALLVLLAMVEALTAFLQSAERYTRLSRATIIASLFSLVAVLAATARWGFAGLVWSNIAAAVLNATVLARALRAEHVHVSFRLHTGFLRRLAAFGIPLRVVDYPIALLAEVDMLFVGSRMGLATLAVYGTAKMVFNQAVQVMSWLGLVVIVRMYRKTGEGSTRRALGEELDRYLSVCYLVLLPVLIVTTHFAASMVIARWLPKYAGASAALPALLIALYFVPQTSLFRNFWILDRNLAALGLSNTVGLGATCLAIWAAPRAGVAGMIGVASGVSAGYLVYYMWLLATIGREALGARVAVRVFTFSLTGAAVTAAALWFSGSAAPAASSGPAFGALGRFAVSLLLILPIMVYGTWKMDLLTYTLRALRPLNAIKTSR